MSTARKKTASRKPASKLSAAKSPKRSSVKIVKKSGISAKKSMNKTTGGSPKKVTKSKPAAKGKPLSTGKKATVSSNSKSRAAKLTKQKLLKEKKPISQASKRPSSKAKSSQPQAVLKPVVKTVTDKVAKPKAAVMKPIKKPEFIPPPSNTKPEIVAKIKSAQASKELRKDLAQSTPKPSLVPITPVLPLEKGRDRLILMVRDAYWLHAHWDVTRQSVERARVSIAEHWHTAKPVLRMIKLDDNGTTSNAETVYRDIEIHGGVRNWYIEVETAERSFKVLMGYVTSNGRFFELARSNTVVMPIPGGKEAADDHWADIAKDAERIYAMSGGYNEDTQSGDLEEVFEERLKRTMDTDVLSQFGSGAEGGLKRHKQFHFEVDAELVVFGTTHPDAHVNIGGEPVKVRSDGSFSIRLPLPDRRQVLPATAKSRDGVDEQTVVIAVERNTKVMEPLSMDAEDL